MDIGDTILTLGTLDISGLGINSLYITHYTTGFSDGGNALGNCYLDVNSPCSLKIQDVVTKTSGGTLASGNSIYMEFNIVVPYTNMLDSACNQFIFKRTA